MKTSIQTHEDDLWTYGCYEEDGHMFGSWMKLKEDHWSSRMNWAEVVREGFAIPLNNEMMKQISSKEGDLPFLWGLWIMCNIPILELTEKQVNFMARVYLAYGNLVHPLVLGIFAQRGLAANKSTKEIESVLRGIQEKYVSIS